MTFHVVFSEDARKALKKLDTSVAMLLLGWIRKNLEGCEDPRRHGKALTAKHRGKWRYRVGDYRMLAEIRDAEVVILVLDIGHRRELYRQ